MNYSAHGQAVHLAARMEQMAVPGTILISSQTLHLAQGYVVTRSLGPMFVKGLHAPVLSYELLGAVAVSRLQALARRGLTRFVGRGGEIEQLRHALDLAAAHHGQIVALVGEPGVGKSRLIHEFTRAPYLEGLARPRSRRGLLWLGHQLPAGHRIPQELLPASPRPTIRRPFARRSPPGS